LRPAIKTALRGFRFFVRRPYGAGLTDLWDKITEAKGECL
jgi:hypothetical protein